MRVSIRHIKSLACRACILVTLLSLLSVPALADQEPEYWPCIQRYVPLMSIATVWPEATNSISSEYSGEDSGFEDLITSILDLNLKQQALGNHLSAYMDQFTTDKHIHALLLYQRLFAQLQDERTKALHGIMRYAKRQQQMIERIEQRRRQIITSSADLDDKELENLSIDQAWETRLFVEREKQLNYLCELPVRIEQRVFFVAQFLNNS